jgi:hypothetical protein
MATLFGTKIQDTYDGLLKVTDNIGITGTKKFITDGLGVNSSVKISSLDFEVANFFFIDVLSGQDPSNYKVGINTSSPTQMLHVVGNMRLTGAFYDSNNATGTSGQILSSTASGTDWVDITAIQTLSGSGTTNYLTKWTNTTVLGNSILYETSSKIGIGTITPTEKLHVNGNVAVDGELHLLSSNEVYGIIKPENSIIKFYAGDGISATGTPDVIITGDGNSRLGVNVASPDEALHVVGDALITGDSHADAFKPAVTANPIKFKNFASTELMRITDTGLVGIANNSPSYTLDVSGTARVSGETYFVTQANSDDSNKVATTAYVKNLIEEIPAGLIFQGTWNASTNTPTLTSGSGTTGHFYIVSTDGSTDLDGITDWKVGDWAVFVEQGVTDQWEKIDNSSVLDGSGTGQKVTLWSGSGTSNTLTDAPITISGNDATFAGTVTATDFIGDDGAFLPLAGGTMTGNINFNDNVYARFGNQPDFEIGHDTNNSYISHTGVGNLIIQNTEDNADIIFKSDNGSGGVTQYFRLDGGSVTNQFLKTVKLYDAAQLWIGDDNDFQIYFDGSNSYIDNSTGALLIRELTNDADVIIQSDNGGGGLADYFRADGSTGSSILYNYGNKKFETTSTGASVLGRLDLPGTNTFFIESNNTAATFNLSSSTRGYNFINSNATLLSLNSAGNATFAGDITLNGEIYGRTSATYPGLGGLGFYSLVPYLENANQGGLKIQVQQGNSLVDALTLDFSKNATFVGKILAGTGATASATINAYTTTVSTNLFSALRVIENSTASSYWDIGATGGSSTLLNFYHNATTSPKISFTHTGGATFSSSVGIGLTNPLAKLDVDGVIRSTDNNSGDYLDIYCDGSVSGNSIIENSANNIEIIPQTGTLQVKGDNNNAELEIFNSSDVVKVKLDTSGDSYLNGGNLGIGRTSFINARLFVEGPVDTATISTSSTPAARINNGGAITNWIGSNGYNYGYIQSIQDDGSNNLKPLSLQPLGGNLGIGLTNPQSKLQVVGGIQMANDTDTASASKVGTLKYYTSGNNSYVDMCMQTGATTYEWINIVQNNW